MTDQTIVELYWQRDETAISATQEKYHAYLMKIARNVLDSTADCEESVNDTYLAAWNSIPPHRPAALNTYLGKLTRRIAISRFRYRSAQKRQGGEYALSLAEIEDIVTDGTQPQMVLEEKLLGELLNKFLRTLKPVERNTFIGRYFYMDPLKEVAAYCGISEGKAKTLLFRTRQKLRVYLEKEGFVL